MMSDTPMNKGKLRPCIHHFMFRIPFSVASKQERCVAIYDAHDQ